MRSRSTAVAGAEEPATPSGTLLLMKPEKKHQLCDKPDFTPWSDEKDKFGPGTIWQCGECQAIYLATGNDPVVSGFWTRISARKARRLLKRHGHQILR